MNEPTPKLKQDFHKSYWKSNGKGDNTIYWFLFIGTVLMAISYEGCNL